MQEVSNVLTFGSLPNLLLEGSFELIFNSPLPPFFAKMDEESSASVFVSKTETATLHEAVRKLKVSATPLSRKRLFVGVKN